MEENGKEKLRERQTYSTFHSSEVQEIMGRQPAWILRWGITMLILILAGIIAACYFIKYPQTVTAAITLTSDNPPADLAAKTTGFLDFVRVKEGERIKSGELIALIAGAADYGDVSAVEKIAAYPEKRLLGEYSREKTRWEKYNLGDIQQSWIELLSVCSDYRDYLSIDLSGKKRRLLSEQVTKADEYYRKLERQRITLLEDLECEKGTLARDSMLLHRKAISRAEYDNTLKACISKKNGLAGFDATMANARLVRLQLEQQIEETETQRKSEEAEYGRRMAQACKELSGRIALWKEQYAIVSPCKGTVSLQNVWSRGQHVSVGELIASVTPDGGEDIIGRMKVTSSGFGKVKCGQEVNIKLNGFPYLEFGILKGVVGAISPVPERTADGLRYNVNVSLPQGLESTYHKEFPFIQDMDGIAEIITKDRRLIEQFTLPVRSLFTNR